MTPNKLSVIIPFAQEHPQIAFTVQNIYCELRDKCDFEIIVIDNYCSELQYQLDAKNEKQDNGSKYMSELANEQRPWLKYLHYAEKLSHWQAKNLGVHHSSGEFLWFVDSHCIVSPGALSGMFEHYRQYHKELNGTLHMPISYMLERPGLELIYKLIHDREHGVMHYTFTRYIESDHVYRVPCMSTCGMMMSRELYDLLGGWPSELGIYGGGEHFINFTLATMGKTINIIPVKPLYHYAAPRGYSWNYIDYHRNRCIATYMFGGEEWAYRYIMNIKPHDSEHDAFKQAVFSSVIGSKACIQQRNALISKQKTTIDAWLEAQKTLFPKNMCASVEKEN